MAVPLMVAVLLAVPTVFEQLEEEHRLRLTYVTPHVEWGRPWKKGPIRALAFCVGKYEFARDLVELMQRFDIEITAVYFWRNRRVIHFTGANPDVRIPKNPPGSDGVVRASRLLDRRWDLFIFGNIDPDVLPLELQYKLFQQVVREGAGIVCVGPKADRAMPDKWRIEAPDFVTKAVPVRFLPASDGKGAREIIKCYRIKKGRGVLLDIPKPLTFVPSIPASVENLVELEYWYALVGAACLWAAGREVPKNEWPEVLTVRRRLRRLDGFAGRWHEGRARGEGIAGVLQRLKGTALPAGRYFVEQVFKDGGGKVVGFKVDVLDVPAPDGIKIVKLTLDKDFAEPGEPIRGKVELSKANYSGLTLLLEERDSWGRVLFRREFPLSGSSEIVKFSIPTSAECTILMRLEASLWRGGRQLTSPAVAEFKVTKRRHDGRFHLVMWDAPWSAVGYFAFRKLREVGFDVCLKGSPTPVVAMADMSLVPYTTRILETRDERGIMKPCCWNAPEASERWIEGIVKRQIESRKHGVFVYSLGDETTTKGCCLSPHCLKAYREFLRERYGSIEALNRAWGAKYRSFDEVRLLSPSDVYETEAFRRGIFARWFDRLSFSQWNFLRLCKRFGEKFKELDPEALTGFEGAGGFGDDIEGIVKTNGFWNPYPSVADEILRSLAPPGYIRGNWIGYQRDPEPLIYWFWRAVMNGCPSVWWWRWDGIGRFHGYLAPDFELYDATRELTKDTRIVREGLGDLLVKCRRVDDGVALLYSVPAAAALRLPDSKNYVPMPPQREHEAWTALLKGAGIGFRYVTERQVERGDLRNVKVLILPFVRALSNLAARRIAEFVERGGALVADLRPAEFTDHLARRLSPALDDVFGVRHLPEGRPRKVNLGFDVKLKGIRLSLDVGEVPVETALRPSRGRALAGAEGAPVLIVNRKGKGVAVLLNFSPAWLPGWDLSTEKGLSARRFVAHLLRALGVEPEASLDLSAKGAEHLVDTACWRDGDLLIYAVRGARIGEEGRAILRLRRDLHAYDLREGRYLGFGRKFAVGAKRARFLVLSPEGLSAPSARLLTPEVGPSGQVAVEVRAPESPRALYAVHMELLDPEGRPQIWARRNVLVEAGRRTTVRLFLGLNPPPGRWTVITRDLFTQAEKKFFVNVLDKPGPYCTGFCTSWPHVIQEAP